MHIGIIGGGIAGLANAICLARKGHHIDVYEQSPAFEEVGAGLQAGPNMVHILKSMGVFETLEPLAVSPPAIRIMDALSGDQLASIELGERFTSHFGQPYRVVHRADLLGSLVITARNHSNIKLHTNHKLTNIVQNNGEIKCSFTNQQTIIHKHLIAADGVRSRSRRILMDTAQAVYSGHTLYRALVPIDQMLPFTDRDCVHLWLYPNGHVVHYPVSAGKNINIVAVFEQNWEYEGWSCPAPDSEVTTRFSKCCSDLKAILSAPESWLKWAGCGLATPGLWHHGNIAFAGDAVHPTLPYLAQGAAMAIEDAAVLADCISRDNGLQTYQSLRQPRTTRIVETSSRLGKIYHMSGTARHARNFVISSSSTAKQYKKLGWLYNWRP